MPNTGYGGIRSKKLSSRDLIKRLVVTGENHNDQKKLAHTASQIYIYIYIFFLFIDVFTRESMKFQATTKDSLDFSSNFTLKKKPLQSNLDKSTCMQLYESTIPKNTKTFLPTTSYSKSTSEPISVEIYRKYIYLHILP